jgi:regulator of protease activity HflC (stomatin/prohibitin superfamily)
MERNLPEIQLDALKGKVTRPLKYVFGAIAALILITFLNPFVTVGAGERGVVLNFGAVQPVVLGEGLHFRVPIMQQVIKMDVTIHKSQTDAESVSKDLQDTKSTIAVNYHILPEKANWIYQNIRQEYKERIIDPAVQEVVKAITARYTAVDLITQREKVRSEIKDMLKSRLLTYDIVVDDFSIVNFKFSQQFEQAIEAKQTAEQLALKAQRDLERIKIEAEQKVASAKAEAEALRLQKENVTPQLVKLRQIEASIKAIDKWDGRLPKINSGAVPFIDVKSLDNE